MLSKLWKPLACGLLCTLTGLAGGCAVESDAAGFFKHVSVEDSDTWKNLDGCYVVAEFQATDTYFDGMFSDTHTVSPADYRTTGVTIRRMNSGQLICQSALVKPILPALTPGPVWWTRSKRYYYHLFRQGYCGTYRWSADTVKMVAIDPNNADSAKAVADDAEYWIKVIAPNVHRSDPIREQLRLVCRKNLLSVIRGDTKNSTYKPILDELEIQAP